MRDDFTLKVRQRIGCRASFLCSNPECCCRTVGPTFAPDGVINLGVAAHITAAAPGGPRYDPSLTREDRKSVSNGIWLCQRCGKLVDSDVEQFPVDLLRQWKQRAEDSAAHALRTPSAARHDACQISSNTLGGEWPDSTGWNHLIDEAYDQAIVEFKAALKHNDQDPASWTGLAWCHYHFCHYRDALQAINRACALAPDSRAAMAAKGCILAEQGVEENGKPSLLQAKQIFASLLHFGASWELHYNLGNVLSALSEFGDAVKQYRLAIKLDENKAMVWKNLASAYFYLGCHSEELDCYDTALRLDPCLAEALVCKGVTLITQLDQPREGAALLETAIDSQSSLAYRWPHVWYWLATGLQQQAKYDEALETSSRGLEIAPNHIGLLNLKAQLFSEACKADTAFAPKGIEFFEFLLALEPTNNRTAVGLAELYVVAGQYDQFWTLIDKESKQTGGPSASRFKRLSVDAPSTLLAHQYLGAYTEFRIYSPMERLKGVAAGYDLVWSEECVVDVSLLFSVSLASGCKVAEGRGPASLDSNGVMLQIWPQVRAGVLRSVDPLVADLITPTDLTRADPEFSEVVGELLSAPMLAIADILLIEASGQIGYIAGAYGLDNVDDVANKTIAEFHHEVIEAVLFSADDRFSFFRSQP